MHLIIEGVRSFFDRQEIPFRPLTLLVGENSTGKTTALAALQAIAASNFPGRIALNAPPYDLGDYRSVASYPGGARGRTKSFVIGWRAQDEEGRDLAVEATYRELNGIPALSSVATRLHRSWLSATIPWDGDDGTIVTKEPKKKAKAITIKHDPFKRIVGAGDPLFEMLLIAAGRGRLTPLLHRLLLGVSRDGPSARSIAPVRTRPRRIYDEALDEYSPEGDHVPYQLARRVRADEVALIEAMNAFGAESGLFEEIKPRRLGTEATDPFRLMVKTKGRRVTVADVGYGVSQVLPILVESVTARKRPRSSKLDDMTPRLLMQQPEVHLHPRAQAAIGSLLARLVRDTWSTFAVETHSDYLVDRVRLELARGTLRPEDVQLLYFERTKTGATTVNPIELDEQGNLLDAPSGYRSFFLKEELRLLRGG